MRFHLSLVLFVTFLSTLFGLVPWHITGARLRSSPSSCSASIDEEDEEDSRYAPEYHRKMRENYPKTSEVWPRNWPDFSKLKPSDPLFLDMPWPTERGPEASAYARHLQWKRLLSDGDRKRWQKWAVYARLQKNDIYKYGVEDYIFHNMLDDLKSKATKAAENGDHMQASLWKAMASNYGQDEELQVTSVVRAFYSAINRKSLDDLQSMWLPDENAELMLPGYNKFKGYYVIDKFYRHLVTALKHMENLDLHIISVKVSGFVAVVHGIEVVGAPSSSQPAMVAGGSGGDGRQGQGASKHLDNDVGKRLFTTTVLRKMNKQWRVLVHHAARLSATPLEGEAIFQPTAPTRTGSSAGVTPLDRLIQAAGVNEGTWVDLENSVKGGPRGRSSAIPLSSSQHIVNSGRNVGVGAQGQGLKVETVRQMMEPIVDEISQAGGRLQDRGLRSSGNVSGGDEEVEEGDDFVSTSKKALLALRQLRKKGRLTRDEKHILMMDIISNVAEDEHSVVEVSFDLLVMQALALSRYELLSWVPSHTDVGMEDFLDQCHNFLDERARLQAKTKSGRGGSGKKTSNKSAPMAVTDESPVIDFKQSGSVDLKPPTGRKGKKGKASDKKWKEESGQSLDEFLSTIIQGEGGAISDEEIFYNGGDGGMGSD